jgi:ABC-type uncharacterized transport system auxiliary subunit
MEMTLSSPRTNATLFLVLASGLFLSGCATRESVEHARAAADSATTDAASAMAAAQHAQATADSALTAARAAATSAQGTIDRIDHLPPPPAHHCRKHHHRHHMTKRPPKQPTRSK